ncbi:VOC family protein [Nocardia otitidiscaviarum]|uniref:VOC family protein n=1 Tax=Nocardia otitidiscaviarum TaxID=1823 RepID=A0A516NU21_9NOCA|nr:VOC family protein [Nocardia otitidiscaviarum]MBF6178985.1 VOC family protein [Nocardia otitidiscaviarum]MCP9621696.1 VOC family protein [Nocardia otitidiscaviarum]QDP82361.1 VOC family protein [Nocardia otitidiscaviarum]
MSLTIANITIDCADAAALAAFWSQLLDRPVDPDANQFFATVGRTAGASPTLMFLAVPDKNPGKNVVHLDLVADDLPAQIDRAVALGAKHIGDFDEYGVRWTTLADPEGNLFDIAAG